MKIKIPFALLLLNCVCAIAQAQFADCMLFDAYQKENMQVWADYLNSSSFSSLTTTEQHRYLDYEYGYTAAAIDMNRADAMQRLDSFALHIEQASSTLPSATILAYRSALAAYRVKVRQSTISNALRSFRYAEQAYEADSLNPLAITMQGNIRYFAPGILGGNKKKAQHYFLRAAQIYRQTTDTTCSWQYHLLRQWE